MIAFLGMYDMPDLRPANDRFWQAIRARLGSGPDKLTRSDDPWPVWQSPDLLFAQTCGMPLRTRLHQQVQLVGTPDYGLPGCAPGFYNSVMIARIDDPRGDLEEFEGATLAYNEALSQSGWAAPTAHAAEHGLTFGGYRETGAHAAAARVVAKGQADLAGIDALTWALLQEHEPALSGQLKEVTRTAPTPALPFITGRQNDPAKIAAAVTGAITDLSDADRQALHIHALVPLPLSAYLAVPTPPPPPAK